MRDYPRIFSSNCNYEAHEEIKPIFNKPDLLKKY